MLRAAPALAAALLSLAGCTTTLLDDKIERKTGAVGAPPLRLVFVPGFKGSALSTPDGDLVWVTATEALLGSRSLALSPAVENPIGLEPFGVIGDVALFKGLISVDGYSGTAKRLSDLAVPVSVHPVPYDWRRSSAETSHAIDRTVSSLRLLGDGSRIVLVGHSMGGLGVAYYLRYGTQPPERALENWSGAQAVDGVVFAGVPFRGALTILRDSQRGILTGLNRTLLGPLAVASFPSTYELLPSNGTPPVLTRSGAPISEAFFVRAFWRRFRWGLLRDERPPPDADALGRHLDELLASAQRFSSLLHAPVTVEPARKLRVLNIIGIGYETMTRAMVHETGLLFTRREFQRAGYDPEMIGALTGGDRIVPADSAELPAALAAAATATTVRNHAMHHKLFLSERTSDALSRWLEELYQD